MLGHKIMFMNLIERKHRDLTMIGMVENGNQNES
jgi:hypothetical protein